MNACHDPEKKLRTGAPAKARFSASLQWLRYLGVLFPEALLMFAMVTLVVVHRWPLTLP